MTKRKNLSKSERFAILEKKVEQLEMTHRVAQMLIQQIGKAVSPMSTDLGELAQRQREVQYRVLALQELLSVSTNSLSKKSEELQIKDFNDASDKEDAEKGYTVADVVSEDSAIILTSKTPNETEDKGYFRSKLLISELGFPALKEALLGKKVGDVVESDINGVMHAITILGIRTVPKKKEELINEQKAS